ncbi:MAG: bifunctional metallophosphatase/5'-nucleotidase [Betaproteobacteria bacterium]|nr:bifunctional metallophosphatase/5'-nucleotidase [Betaproteobacteria bacterium]
MIRTAISLGVALFAGACALAPPPAPPLELRLVAFNDFHGHLESPPFGWIVADAGAPGGKTRVGAGGVANLATAIRELRGARPHSAVVGAGDLVSASPLVSGLFLDEPSITALGQAGLEVSSVGNHEFDRGREEFERLVKGGCHPKEGCFGEPYAGASFRYLAANVIDTSTGRPAWPAYEIKRYEGVPVAFVGAVLKSTPTIVDPRGVRGLEFRDEADAVNALVPELRRQGVEAIVLLIHEGGRSTGEFNDPACPGFEGDIVGIVKRLDPAVDVVVSGHTHQAYRCRIDGRLVTSAGSYGRIVTTIDLAIDRATRDVIGAEAQNVIVETTRFAADPAIAGYVEKFAQRAAERAGHVVGTVRGEFTPLASSAGESNLGGLIARAQLAAMKNAAGAQVAFMNPGGIRAPLASRRPDAMVTYGDLFSVQPFGNTLVAVTLTGTQILRVLEQQFRAPPDRTRILQVAGIAYSWDGSRPLGHRIVPGSVSVEGARLDERAGYRVTMNSFLFGGGDGFTVFTEGRDATGGPGDLAAFQAYIAAAPRVAGPPEGRIRRIDGGT